MNRPPPAALPRHPAEAMTARQALIAQSHQRCRALGLTRIERPDFAPLGRSDLALARERSRRLHVHALPVMEMLSGQIADTESMVVLCDATGTVIHAVGDDDFLARADKVALRPGVNWSEQAKGTNAIGTALVDEVPVLVHADEHYLHANQFLTCSAAPILDPRGNVLGVLDVTGDHRSVHPHTMALVRMSVRMIENHWLHDDFGHALRLHFHRRPECLGTLVEGIVAVGDDGRIVGANRSALELLGLSGAALRRQTVEALFGLAFGALADRSGDALAVPLLLRGADGQRLHALVRGAARADTTARAGAAAAPTSPTSATASAAAPMHGAAGLPALSRLSAGDPAVERLAQTLRRVIDRDIPVLVVGETGSGKAWLARALHRDSARAAGPFVAVQCAAVPPAAVESVLFGDGTAGTPGGALAQALGGTLFLDDVDELPPAAQARLLHLLDTPPGRTAALDPMLVCATAADLGARAAEGRFRADLVHRLGGFVARLPPLRERSDLPALARRLLDEALQAPRASLSPAALAHLAAHRWPGNLRELHNALRTGLLLAGDAAVLQPEHLPDVRPDVRPTGPDAGTGRVPGAATPDGPAPAGAALPLQALEAQAIRQAVAECGGNIAAASRRLGISRNTLYRKLRARVPSPA